jgi:hypothetical protein
MNWLDVAGSPGSGKSTLCDAFYGPHALPIIDALPPASWQPFVDEVTKLFAVIETHPTYEAAVRMNNRSFRKIGTVARMEGSFPYIQTGLVQRLTGFGWRMVDMGVSLDPLVPALKAMPVSVGVVFTVCDPDIVQQRNYDREKVEATAHENRAFMVALMAPAIELAKEVLHDRGVPVLELSTEQPIEDARRQLVDFAMQNLGHAEKSGYRGEMAPVQTPPSWWRA